MERRKFGYASFALAIIGAILLVTAAIINAFRINELKRFDHIIEGDKREKIWHELGLRGRWRDSLERVSSLKEIDG